MAIVHTTYARVFNEDFPRAVLTTAAAHNTKFGDVIVRLWERPDARLSDRGVKAEVRLSIARTEALIESLTASVEEAKRLLEYEIAAIAITNSIPE